MRNVITRGLLIALLTLSVYAPPVQAATLLPNGEQTFVDQNGLPLAAGCVSFYVPGTNNPKDTYLDPAGSTTNSNPVVLDAAGRAIIYGVGSYRQVVQKYPCGVIGEQVWDQLTADTASSITIFAGASAGTPNAVTVTAPSFTGTDGQVINYISTNTNTGGATINPSGFGNVQIVRDGATGPGALVGGELVATNAVSLIYDATAGTFHILSPVTWPNTSGVPVGATIDVRGFNAPTNYAFTYGQAVNRTTYAALFGQLTLAQTGSISSGSPNITALSDTTQLGKGMPVEAVGINAGTKILSCTGSACIMDSNATLTRSGTMTFFAYGNGDGSLTFNLPDDRGKVLVGRDNIGGTAANVLQVATTLTTTSASAAATAGSGTGLQLGMFVLNPNVTPGTTISAINGTAVTLSAPASGSAVAVASRFSVFPDPQALGNFAGMIGGSLVTTNLPPYTPAGSIVTTSPNPILTSPLGSSFQGGGALVGGTISNNLATFASTFTGTAQGGLSIPVSIIQPSNIVNRAIRLVP